MKKMINFAPSKIEPFFCTKHLSFVRNALQVTLLSTSITETLKNALKEDIPL